MLPQKSVDAVVDELTRRYPEYPRRAIESLVRRHAATFRDAAVRTYLPILVRRCAETELRYLQDGIDAETALIAAPDGRVSA